MQAANHFPSTSGETGFFGEFPARRFLYARVGWVDGAARQFEKGSARAVAVLANQYETACLCDGNHVYPVRVGQHVIGGNLDSGWCNAMISPQVDPAILNQSLGPNGPPFPVHTAA
jgi:hypothetical protein